MYAGYDDGPAGPGLRFTEETLTIEAGLGVACPEAQPDGVPCPAPDTSCEECARARREGRRAAHRSRTARFGRDPM